MLKKILSGSLFVLLGNSLARGIFFLFNIIVARLIDIDSYGQYSIIKSTISTIVNMVNGSVNISITKLIAQKRDENSKSLIYSIFLANFILAIILIVTIYFSKDYFIDKYLLGKENLYYAFNLSLIYLFFSLLGTLIQSALIGYERFKDIAIANFFSSIIFLPLGCLLVYKFGLMGTIYSLILFFILFSLFQYLKLSKYINKYKNEFSLKEIVNNIKHIFSFSILLVFSSFIVLGLFWYARILLVNESQNFEEIAIFDAAYQLISIIMIITGAVTSVVLPMLSNSKSRKNSKEMFKILNITLLLNFVFSLFVSITIMYLSSFIMGLYGDNFIKGSNILEVIIFASVFFSLSSVLNKFMIANNSVLQAFIITIFSALVFYFILINTISEYGALSLSYSMIIYYAISSILYLVYIFIFIKKETYV